MPSDKAMSTLFGRDIRGILVREQMFAVTLPHRDKRADWLCDKAM
jgi:hypothetical protein